MTGKKSHTREKLRKIKKSGLKLPRKLIARNQKKAKRWGELRAKSKKRNAESQVGRKV